MNILILNWRDIKSPLAGGAEIATHEYAKGWVKAGHKVTQFSSSFTGGKPFEEIDGIKIIRKGNHYTVHLHAFFYYITALRGKINLVVDEFHFIPFFTPLYVHTQKIGFIHEIAKELWFENKSFPISILGYFLEPFFFRFYNNVPFMTCSNSTKEEVVKLGISSKNITIIHNGINIIKSVKVKEKDPILVYLGRLTKDKGIEDAIYAFTEIQKSKINVKFWIIGKEEEEGYQKKLEKLVENLGINDSVFFMGYVSERKKFDFLKRAWVLIHPSVKEGWGLTVIEAASQRTPTVAYDVSGLRDSIINGKTGLLVSSREPKALASKIMILIENKVLYNELSKNALIWSREFNWDDSISESIALIERIT